MPPELDIYAFTKHRDRATIERFLDEYVDRAAAEDRGDEDILLENPAYFTQDWAGQWSGPSPDQAWETEPAYTLSHIIDRGLAHPRRAFTAYLQASVPGVDGVILAFTRDDQVVLGVAIDDPGAQPENEIKAKELLAHLMETYRCHAGLIVVEKYPPLGERELQARATDPSTVFHASRDQPMP